LSVRGRILGILDLQSKMRAHFNKMNWNPAIPGRPDRNSVESVRLINDTQAFANELEMLASQQTGEEWQRYLASRAIAYQFTPSGTNPSRRRNQGKRMKG